MEIPKFWREMPTNVSFEGSKKEWKDTELTTFKYPGGEIPLVGSFDDIKDRFVKKGFNEVEIVEILYHLFGAVATKSAVPVGEFQKSFFELIRSEVRK